MVLRLTNRRFSVGARQKYASILVLCILLTSHISLCFAQQTPPILSLAVPPFPPFAYYHSPKECLGVINELTNNIAARSHIKLVVKKLPYPRIINRLHYEQLDSAFIFKNYKLLINNIITDKIRYAGPFAFSKVLIISKKDKQINHYDDLASLTNIAVIRKASFDERFDLDRTINKAYVGSYYQGLKMMLSNRVDAIIGSQIGLEHNMQMLNLNLEDYHRFELSFKEWGLHYRSSAFNEEQEKNLHDLVKEYQDHNILYNLYHKKLGMHIQCSNQSQR
jgi:polar amino acid transport system substrate-binding protein